MVRVGYAGTVSLQSFRLRAPVRAWGRRTVYHVMRYGRMEVWGYMGCEDGSGLGTSHERKQVDAERILGFLGREDTDAARPVINEQMHPSIIIMLRP